MKYKLIIDKNAEEEVVVTAHAASPLTEQIEKLVLNGFTTEGILGHRDDEMRKLGFSEIECVTVLDRKVIAVDTDGIHYRITQRLRELENILPSYFIRINKSTLANEHRIARFHAVFNGGVEAVFGSGYRDYVSRRCFREIKRRYEEV